MTAATATGLEVVTPLVRDWCGAHADRIQACYLTDRSEGAVTMVLVGRFDPFDDVLADALDDFLRRSWRANGVFILPWQSGPGPEAELCQVYPVRPSDRVFGG
jgi:hypothetical protein